MAIELPNTVTKGALDHLVAQSKTDYAVFDSKLTVAVITLPNKFKVIGQSSCVDANNFNKELGEKYALENAVEKLWEFEGYLLANDIYRAKQPESYAARMIFEQSDLREKLDKLCDFLSKPQPSFIDNKEWGLLLDQRDYMSEYFNILEIRIKIALSKNLESNAIAKTVSAFQEKVSAEISKCTAPQDPDHELTEDEVATLASGGSLCDCAWVELDGTEHPIEEGDLVDFGTALHLMELGERVQREGWNGKGMFVYIVPAASYPAQRNAKGVLVGDYPNDMVPYSAYIALKTASGEVVPWTISQSDALAIDWCLA